jgi:hypothetical protein
MRLEGKEMRNFGNNGLDHLEDLGIYGRIILK